LLRKRYIHTGAKRSEHARGTSCQRTDSGFRNQVDASETQEVETSIWHSPFVYPRNGTENRIAFRTQARRAIEYYQSLRETLSRYPMDAQTHESATSGDGPTSDAVTTNQSATGLKPIERLTSDDRIARIIPTADYGTDIEYYSGFARDFIRAHYNFCAAKMTVARGGKKLALDFGFRDSEEWLGKAIAWANKLEFQSIPMLAEVVHVSITIPLAGRLVSLINDYDLLFVTLTAAVFAGSITNDERNKAFKNASRKIMAIHQICVPDTDRYDVGGSLLETTQQ
jgi:hypothetical protein